MATHEMRIDIVVSDFKEKLRRLKSTSSKLVPVRALVLTVERYLTSSKLARQFGAKSEEDGSAFDVTVSDTRHKLKCILNPALNNSIHKNIVHAGCVVELSDCTLTFDETRVGGGSIVVINAWRPLGLYSQQIDIGDISHCAETSDREKKSLPLGVDREYYLPLWNDDDPYGDQWKRPEPRGELAADSKQLRVQCNVTLREVIDRSKVSHLQKPYPPLVLKVLSRGRFCNFGKASRHDKFPYQMYLEVGDKSGCTSLVFWTHLVPEYFNRVREGVVIQIASYKVRSIYAMRKHPLLRVLGLPTFDSELVLNADQPRPSIQVLRPSQRVEAAWGLPHIDYQFLDRAEIGTLNDKIQCDVCGVITFVGRFQRLRNAKKVGNFFWTMRFVHIQDCTSKFPIIVELFSTSQPEVFAELRPGQILVCSHMKVVNPRKPLSPRQQLFPYLTTTHESQIFIKNHHQEAYCGAFNFNILKSWRESKAYKQWVPSFHVGGYYHYPPLPDSYKEYQKKFAPDREELKLIPLTQVQSELDGLHYRETRRVLVQGTFSAVATHTSRPAPATTWRGPDRHLPSTSRGTGAPFWGDTRADAPSREGATSSPLPHNALPFFRQQEAALGLRRSPRNHTSSPPGVGEAPSPSKKKGVPPGKTVKRPRGRPRKQHRDQDRNSSTSSEESPDRQAPAKRPRGRPRRQHRNQDLASSSSSEESPDHQAPAKRPRGRPRRQRRNQDLDSSSSSEGGLIADDESTSEPEHQPETTATRAASSAQCATLYQFDFAHGILPVVEGDGRDPQPASSPHTFSRRWSAQDGDLLRRELGLQPSVIGIPPAKPLQDVPIAEGHSTWFTFTIAGLNRNSFIQAVFFPAAAIAPPDPSRPHLLSVSQPLTSLITRSNTGAENRTSPVTIENEEEFSAFCESVREKRFIFVLDLFRCSGAETEVVLNRAYPTE